MTRRPSRWHSGFLLAGAIMSLLQARTADAGWRDAREALDRRHVAGLFRIHYATVGPDAVGGATGDLALRLGEQLERGHRFYAEVLGLTPPPANLRYRGLKAIDVHVLAMEGKKGSTGDEPIIYSYRHFEGQEPALTISISSRWQPGNLTPEHEVFHAYQYGYTFFKTPWFLEGMANGMEAAFRIRPFDGELLPQDVPALRLLLGQSYGAGRFWLRLMGLCEPGCGWSSAPAIAEGRACGGFVKPFLEELQKADKTAAWARGLDPNAWPESEQRSTRNDEWLLSSLARTVGAQCPVGTNAELKVFLDVLKAVGGQP